jgi:hypothetical protein
MIRLAAKCLILGPLWLTALACCVWAFGALYFDFPLAKSLAAWIFAAVVLACLLALRGSVKKLAAAFIAFGLVLAWWSTLKPTATADWQPDVAELPWAEINGDEIVLHNIRHCDYRTPTDYTPRWETRTVRLSQLTGVDLAITYWGSPWMAHPVVSFQFADALPVCFSIETRKKKGQTYSAIGGLYRQFELICIAADERDVIRLRSNVRKGEEVFLYRVAIKPDRARERFLEYLNTVNQLREQPRWYNAVTTNCTTGIRTQHPASDRLPWDWRLLVNGKADEMLYEQGALLTAGLPFPELKQRALINPAARTAPDADDFSRLIREGRPGFAASGEAVKPKPNP